MVSKNTGTKTTQSPIWKFYNAGEATTSYTPFPAELVAPNLSATLSTTTSTNLEWKGEDVDNDIAVYDVFFGTTNPPADKVSTTSNTSTSVSVSSGNTYYCRIITHDDQNNNSESQVFKFSEE